MTSKTERLSIRLVDEGSKSVRFFQSLPSDSLERELYVDGGRWKIGQIPAHFLATEVGIFKLISSIIEGNPGTPENFDIDRYNEEKVSEFRNLPFEDLLDRFYKQRQSNAKAIESFSDDQLSTKGRHPFLGVTQVEDIVKLLYRHNQIHQRDIRRMLAGSLENKESSIL